MAAGSESGASPTPFGAAVETVRRELDEGRRRARQLHDRGLDGLQVSGRLTSHVDSMIGVLFDAAEAELGATAADVRSHMALTALGSYGRRHSAPYSDVDLMILHDGMPLENLTAIVRKFTNSIYDSGMELGHSVRTPVEAVQLAKGDAVICTSMIDCRLVAGSQPLFESFRGQFAKMARSRSKLLCQAMFEARAKERDQFGESLYLLEPHVKRSRGGLRDLHLLRWLGFALQGESDPDRLHLAGGMTKFEHHRLLSAQLFLLRLRNEMHFHAEEGKDLLDRAEQLRIAEVFGYRSGEGLLPVERLMKDYFRHTNHLWQMVQRRAETLETETTVSRFLNPVLGRRAEGDLRIGVRTIGAAPAAISRIQNNVEEVLRLVELAVHQEKRLDSTTWSALLLAAPEADDEMTPELAERFLRCLSTPIVTALILRMLHQLGYLERIIPPVKHARCLLQFNQYHKYTVDEHSLLAVEVAGEFSRRNDSLGVVYRSIGDKRILHLALLLHDLGKGYEEDHSEVGRRIALETCERLGLDALTTEDVAYLVHKHLSMSHLAFRRDTRDPNVLAEFAAEVGSVERLKMLYVLSCSDLAAVGPDVLTKWKEDLLGDLYHRTAAALGADSPEASNAEKKRTELSQVLSKEVDADSRLGRRIDSLPAELLSYYSTSELAELLLRLHKLEPRGGLVWGRYNAESKTVEMLAGIDQGHGRGLFSSLAGVMSSHGLQILSADTQSLPDGLLMLRYTALDPDFIGAPDQRRLDQVAREMELAIDSPTPPKFRRVWGQEAAEASLKLSAMPNEVRVDNQASQSATVVEVFTFDRTGLLYDLAHKLHELSLTICHAKIATYLDQVVDVFYVTNRDGAKIFDPEQIELIRREMHAAIETSR